MPSRKTPLVTGEIYHVFNKSIGQLDPFGNEGYPDVFMEMVNYYRSGNCPGRFSLFKKLPIDTQHNILQDILSPPLLQIEILTYCLMPTHFHFLLKQTADDGISKFIGNLLNSYTRYFNLKEDTLGPIFLPRFKAVAIQSESQLIHTSRYIAINPYTAGLVKKVGDIFTYPWSSIQEYLTEEKMCNTSYILDRYLGNSREQYKSFIADQADYQKGLEFLKRSQYL